MGSSNRPDLTSRMKNSSYIFVPFSHDDKFAGINVSSYWREKRQGNKYFLKYIVDKLSHDSTSVCCRPYLMDDLARSTLGIISSLQPCFVDTTKYVVDNRPFSFYIREILLFLFETGIGFIIYKIEHDNNDTSDIIASKNYHLKKIHKTLLYVEQVDGTRGALVPGISDINSLSALSKYILEKSIDGEVRIFFNYCTAEEWRSNILTNYNLHLDHCISSEDNTQIESILFHLKRNYHHEWETESESVYNEKEYFKASTYIRWGITSEATVCLTVTDPETYFVSNSFYDNFHTYYLYLYILALHQKYALYYFLTNFSIEQNMAGLEKKLQDLVNFKAKYVFEIISESETYQTVYYKQCKSFALEELYRDIDEQINRVIEVKQTLAEQRRNYQEAKVNWILGLIAFLGFFSALIDLNTLIGCLTWIFNDIQIGILKLIATSVLLLVGIISIIAFLIASKKKNNK